jgi:hypothetical protein
MPTNKDFKRVVRARMHKTGESYTAARAQVLKTKASTSTVESPAPASRPSPTPAQYPKLAGMSDASVAKATGCTWERWVKALDAVEAHSWPHARIAEHVVRKYKVPDWWSQMVVVGYERIKGLRARGQRRDGAYEVTRSKVFNVSVDRVYHAFVDARLRAQWLPGVSFTVRRATKSRSMRITWGDGTNVDVGFFSKGDHKSQVQLAHGKLRDQSDADQRKAFWSERFAALSTILQPVRAAS